MNKLTILKNKLILALLEGTINKKLFWWAEQHTDSHIFYFCSTYNNLKIVLTEYRGIKDYVNEVLLELHLTLNGNMVYSVNGDLEDFSTILSVILKTSPKIAEMYYKNVNTNLIAESDFLAEVIDTLSD